MLNEVTALKQYFDTLTWYQRYFFPSKLRALLESNEFVADETITLSVVKTALDNSWGGTWFFHRFFYEGFRNFTDSVGFRQCQRLHALDLLTDVAVTHNHTEAVANEIGNIYDHIAANNAAALTASVEALRQCGVHENVVGRHVLGMAECLDFLNREDMLVAEQGQTYLKATLKCKEFNPLLSVMTWLRRMLPPENLANNLNDLFARLDDIRAISIIFSYLDEEIFQSNGNVIDKNLAQEYFGLIIQNQNANSIAEAFRKLEQEELLSQDNIRTVASHPSSDGVAAALIEMHKMGVLAGEAAQVARNRQTLIQSQNPGNVAKILEKLRACDLDQDVEPQLLLDSVLRHMPLFGHHDQMSHWGAIQLSLTRWIEMLSICVRYEQSPDEGHIKWMQYTDKIKGQGRRSSCDLLSNGEVNLEYLLKAIASPLLSKDPEGLARVIVQINSPGIKLLSNGDTAQQNLQSVARLIYADIPLSRISAMLYFLIDQGLLAAENPKQQENYDAWVSKCDQNHEELPSIFGVLQTSHPVVTANIQHHFDKIFDENAHLSEMLPIFEYLHAPVNILALPEASHILDLVYAHQYWRSLQEILGTMQKFYLTVLSANERALCVDRLLQHASPKDLEAAVKTLEMARSSRQISDDQAKAFFLVLIGHSMPIKALTALSQLQSNAVLNQAEALHEYCYMVMHSDNPDTLAQALIDLKKSGMLPPEDKDAGNDNKQSVIDHKDPKKMANALIDMKHASLLNSDNRAALMRSADPKKMAVALRKLAAKGELSDANRNMLTALGEPSPVILADAFLGLKVLGVSFEGEIGDILRNVLIDMCQSDQLSDGVKEIKTLFDAEQLKTIITIMKVLLKKGRINNIEYGFGYLYDYRETLCDKMVYEFLVDPKTRAEDFNALLTDDRVLGSVDSAHGFIQGLHKQRMAKTLQGILSLGLNAAVAAEDAMIAHVDDESPAAEVGLPV